MSLQLTLSIALLNWYESDDMVPPPPFASAANNKVGLFVFGLAKREKFSDFVLHPLLWRVSTLSEILGAQRYGDSY